MGAHRWARRADPLRRLSSSKRKKKQLRSPMPANKALRAISMPATSDGFFRAARAIEAGIVGVDMIS
jgi:hypothetical protein